MPDNIINNLVLCLGVAGSSEKFMTLEELRYKRKGAIIIVCTLGLAGLSKVGGIGGVWNANLFKGTSFDQGGVGFVMAGLSFCFLTVLLAVPMFIIGFIQLIYYSILISQKENDESDSAMVQPITFIASHISSDDNVIYPDKLQIYPNKIEFFKGTVCGYKRTVIAQESVASASIRTGVLFVDVIIETSGGGVLVAEGFYEKTAKEILKYIKPY